jgi:hypothetical protein
MDRPVDENHKSSLSSPPAIKPGLGNGDMDAGILEVDFDKSLNLKGVVGRLVPNAKRPQLEYLRSLYQKSTSIGVSPPDSPRIPKIIHHIWLGSEFPDRFKGYQRNWLRHHPDWEYRLWTDREVERFEFGTADLFHATSCFGQKSDLLRAEILHRHGGLYIDVDNDCFRPLDIFHHAFNLYASITLIPGLYLTWPDVFKSPVLVSNALVGAVPGHPVFGEYLRRMRRNLEDPGIAELSMKLTASELEKPDIAPYLIKARLSLLATYMPFNEAFFTQQGSASEGMFAVPPQFLNPIDPRWNSGRFRHLDYWKALFKSVARYGFHPYLRTSIPECAFAAHHSATSWIQ